VTGEPGNASESELGGEVLPLLQEILKRLEPAPELLAVSDLAALLNISPAQIYKMMERDQLPLAIYIGGSRRLPRWRRTEILLWLRHDAPSRSEWSSLRLQLLSQQDKNV
jgi:predicted DNA-binding transcriptional regulator AlpA